MKQIGLIFLILILTGCYTELKVISPTKTLYGYDFTPYAEKGFLITPYDYSGNYESIGIIRFETFPGANYQEKRIEETDKEVHDDTYFQVHVDNKIWKIDSLSFQESLNEVY